MTKNQLISRFKQHGDLVLEYRDSDYVKKDSLCTIDFSTKYIKDRIKRFMIVRKKDAIVVWNWTDNKLEIVAPSKVFRAVPLANVLNNKTDEGY